MWETPALEFAAAFGAVVGLIWLLDPLARRMKLLDHPGGRKDHHAPTPIHGGLAVAIGTIIPGLLLTEPTQPLIGLGIAAVVLVVVGVIDDLIDLRWWARVLAQVAAALILIYVGGVKVEQIGPVFGLSVTSLGYLSAPFTVAATVGLINALNMADGLDGLAGSLAFCAFVMLIAAAVYAGNTELLNGLVAMAGAVLGFLAFNLRLPWRSRARVFLGNSGSAYLGLIIAWASFRLTQNPFHPVSPVLAPFLIAPPVIDCLVLIARRMLHRKSPFSADRTHAHHLLLDVGLPVTMVVGVLCGLSLVLGLAAGVALLVKVPQWLFLATYGAMTLGYFAITMSPRRTIAALRRFAFRGEEPVATPAVNLAE